PAHGGCLAKGSSPPTRNRAPASRLLNPRAFTRKWEATPVARRSTPCGLRQAAAQIKQAGSTLLRPERDHHIARRLAEHAVAGVHDEAVRGDDRGVIDRAAIAFNAIDAL